MKCFLQKIYDIILLDVVSISALILIFIFIWGCKFDHFFISQNLMQN